MTGDNLWAWAVIIAPASLVLLFGVLFLVRRRILHSLAEAFLVWLLAWVIVLPLAYLAGMVVMFAAVWLTPDGLIGPMPAAGMPAGVMLTVALWTLLLRGFVRKVPGWRSFTLVLAVAVMTAPAPGLVVASVFVRTHAVAVQTSCASNLEEVGVALQMYRADHHGIFPAQLRDLLPELAENESPLHCTATDQFYSYLRPPTAHAPSDRPVVIDYNHPGVLMVVFANGAVRSFHPNEPIALGGREEEDKSEVQK